MPFFSTLTDRCGGPRLLRLLVLLLALAVSMPVLLADDWDHDRDRDHEHGKANDLTGVWTETRSGSGRKVLITFHRDGTASLDTQGDAVFDPVQSPAHGLWKQTGYRTFIATFLVLEYNRDASLYGTALLQGRYTLSPSGDRYDALGSFTETLANGMVNQGGPPRSTSGVRLILTPPPF